MAAALSFTQSQSQSPLSLLHLPLHGNLNLPFPTQFQPIPIPASKKFPSIRFRCSSTFNDKTLITLKTRNTSNDPPLNNPLACRAKFGGQESNKSYVEAYAVGRHIRLSADKARRVVDQIRGRPYEETVMILELMPYRACEDILPIVFSAAANASNNLGLDKGSLIISKVEVNEGSTMKRMRPRAQGRAYQIKKRTCHITIVVKGLASESVVEAKPA